MSFLRVLLLLVFIVWVVYWAEPSYLPMFSGSVFRHPISPAKGGTPLSACFVNVFDITHDIENVLVACPHDGINRISHWLVIGKWQRDRLPSLKFNCKWIRIVRDLSLIWSFHREAPLKAFYPATDIGYFSWSASNVSNIELAHKGLPHFPPVREILSKNVSDSDFRSVGQDQFLVHCFGLGFCGFGSLLCYFKGFAHPTGLFPQYKSLKTSEESEDSCKANHPPIGRRVIILFVGGWGGILLGLIGEYECSRGNRLLGVGLYFLGSLSVILGLGLWWITQFRWSWCLPI